MFALVCVSAVEFVGPDGRAGSVAQREAEHGDAVVVGGEGPASFVGGPGRGDVDDVGEPGAAEAAFEFSTNEKGEANVREVGRVEGTAEEDQEGRGECGGGEW